MLELTGNENHVLDGLYHVAGAAGVGTEENEQFSIFLQSRTHDLELQGVGSVPPIGGRAVVNGNSLQWL